MAAWPVFKRVRGNDREGVGAGADARGERLAGRNGAGHHDAGPGRAESLPAGARTLPSTHPDVDGAR